MPLKKQIQNLAVAIVFLILYYSFFMGFVLDVKDSIVNVLESKNLTVITVPQKVYNASSGQWEERPRQFDLVGFIDIAMTLAIVFAPILFIFRYVF